jgi:V8-like Glu-specific endopeptidase
MMSACVKYPRRIARLSLLTCTGLLVVWPSVSRSDPEDGAQNPGVIFGTDDRYPTKDPAVGRILNSNNAGCTGWLTTFGAILTAGHCYNSPPFRLQFNVPLSNADGTINNPADPKDTYTIEFTKFATGTGTDWGVAKAAPNSGMTPGQRQRAFVRLSNLPIPVNIRQMRVTGYGVAGPPPNYGNSGPKNKFNKTEQTATGPYLGNGKVANTVCYNVDTNPANSGSPVYLNGTNVSIAIHTEGDPNGTNCPTPANFGTNIALPDLVAAMQAFPGSLLNPPIPPDRTLFVDALSVTAEQKGTVMAPFQKLSAAFTQGVSFGQSALITVAPGTYADTATTVKPVKDMRLVLPVGDVTFYPQLVP